MANVPHGVVAAASDSNESEEPHLHRGLSNRHIQMIALGGAIGVGLFMHSGKAIHTAGPALLLCYLLAGAIVFLVMRALGELAFYRPVSGSFAAYAQEFIGPLAGHFTGWTYWVQWIVSGMIELTAVAIYVNKYFIPGAPQWATAIVVLAALFCLNLLSVRMFGESEFWFSLIKVVAIIGIIVLGVIVLLFGIGAFEGPSISNLWENGGIFPNGFEKPLIALQFVVFAFFGVELVGVTAGEAENPRETLPKAIRSVATKMIIFYVGSLTIIMSLVAWNQLDPAHSPFILVFQRSGIPAASAIVNFVVLTAALSACNSSVFSTGRMLNALGDGGHAPKMFTRINKNGVPVRAITASCLLMLFGVGLAQLLTENAFGYIAAIATVGGLMAWGMIMFAHLGYLRAVRSGKIKRSGYRLWGAPYTNVIVLAFLGMIFVLLGFDDQGRIGLMMAPVIIGLIVGSYYLFHEAGRAKLAAIFGRRPVPTFNPVFAEVGVRDSGSISHEQRRDPVESHS